MRLWAQDEEDAAIVSALMQDACIRADETHFDATARRVTMLTSRFCWECETPQRIRAAVRIESVLRARRRNWPADSDTVLDLLGFVVEPDTVTLVFAGGAEIAIDVECIDIIFEDLGEPHQAAKPEHEV